VSGSPLTIFLESGSSADKTQARLRAVEGRLRGRTGSAPDPTGYRPAGPQGRHDMPDCM